MAEHSFEEQLHTALKAESDWKIKICSSTEVIVTNGFPVVLFSCVVRNALDNVQPEENPVLFLNEFSSSAVRHLVEMFRSGFVYTTEEQIYELWNILDVLGICKDDHNFTVETIDEEGLTKSTDLLFNKEFDSNPATPNSLEISDLQNDFVTTNEEVEDSTKKALKRRKVKETAKAVSTKRRRNDSHVKSANLCDFSCEKISELAPYKFKNYQESNSCQWCGQLFSMAIQKLFHICKEVKNSESHLCVICNVKFPEKCIMLAHQQQHFKKNLSCPICFKETENVGYLIHHMRCHTEEIVTSNPSRNILPEDDQTNYISEYDINKQLQIHCSICKAEFVTVSEKVNHKCYLESSITKCFSCRTCSKEFGEECVYLVHCRQHLKPPQSFECPICFQFIPVVSELLTHIRFTHTKELSSYDRTLNREETIVITDSDLECRVCKTVFDVKSHLLLHEAIHEGKDNFLMCKFCGQQQENIARALSHIELHIKNNDSLSENLQCTLCINSTIFGGVHEFFMHREVYHKSYNCFVCKSSFNNINFLLDHFKSHVPALVESFYCKSCGNYPVKTPEEVVLHHHDKVSKTSHKSYYPQNCSCPFCGVQFENRNTVLIHIKSHLGLQKFSCNNCYQLMTFSEYKLHHLECFKSKIQIVQ